MVNNMITKILTIEASYLDNTRVIQDSISFEYLNVLLHNKVDVTIYSVNTELIEYLDTNVTIRDLHLAYYKVYEFINSIIPNVYIGCNKCKTRITSYTLPTYLQCNNGISVCPVCCEERGTYIQDITKLSEVITLVDTNVSGCEAVEQVVRHKCITKYNLVITFAPQYDNIIDIHRYIYNVKQLKHVFQEVEQW